MRYVLIISCLAFSAGAAAPPPGEPLFKKHCAGCHSGGSSTAPSLEVLGKKSASAIRKALDKGVMKQQGSMLTPAERRSVSAWVANSKRRQ